MKESYYEEDYENDVRKRSETADFLAVSCFVLILLSVFDVFPIKAESWYLLVILAVIAIVQWAVIILC